MLSLSKLNKMKKPPTAFSSSSTINSSPLYPLTHRRSQRAYKHLLLILVYKHRINLGRRSPKRREMVNPVLTSRTRQSSQILVPK